MQPFRSSNAHDINAKLLITEVNKIDKINPSEPLIDAVAARCTAGKRRDAALAPA